MVQRKNVRLQVKLLCICTLLKLQRHVFIPKKLLTYWIYKSKACCCLLNNTVTCEVTRLPMKWIWPLHATFIHFRVVCVQISHSCWYFWKWRYLLMSFCGILGSFSVMAIFISKNITEVLFHCLIKPWNIKQVHRDKIGKCGACE